MTVFTTIRRVGIAVAATAAIALPSAASDYVETEALFHARALEEAWDTLATHITRDSAAAVAWSGTAPPASTGWLVDWTARGLGARYCDSLLLVYATTAAMKGVGTNLAAVQLAPHLEAKARNRDVPPLHWLESGTAEGILGRETVALPACMGTLPSDRPALAGWVVDPFTVTTNRITREHLSGPCPSGTHGDGRTYVRQVTQALNGRGDPAGAPSFGPWGLLVDHCRADTVSWEYVRQSCTFTPGAPHIGTLTGEAVWRRQKSVTGAGTSYGAPQFVSTTCWTDPNPTPPTPREWTSTTTQTRSLSCGAGYTGSRTQRRTNTWRHLQWPWDASASVQRIAQTNWATSGNSCRKIPPPDDPPPANPPPDDPPQDDADDDPPEDNPPKEEKREGEETREEDKCTDCGTDDGNSRDGGGNRGGGNVGGGWDTDGDGKADVEHSSQIDANKRSTANYVQGHTPIGRNGGGGGGPGGDAGGSAGGGPGGNRGSGDRGR